MNLAAIEKFGQAELRNYLEFLLWNYRITDAFWFLFVSEEFDLQTAEKINERVWKKIAGMSAKDILKRFGIKERGLRGFVKAQKLFPWAMIIGYEFEEKDDEVIITVPSCAPQVARLARGLPEFSCKDMHQGEFVNFSNTIDERIQVECIFAPPDPHPDDTFCKWRFTLK